LIVFITPPTSAFIAYLTSLATIQVSYFQRIKGGMDSTIIQYTNALRNKDELTTGKVFTLLEEKKEEINFSDFSHAKVDIVVSTDINVPVNDKVEEIIADTRITLRC
jgi:hypothetical protein